MNAPNEEVQLPRPRPVILRRRAGLLTRRFFGLLGLAAVIGALGGWFGRALTDGPREVQQKCLSLKCSVRDPATRRKREGKPRPIWQEEVCSGEADCMAVAQACVKLMFPGDLFMPGSSCVVAVEPVGECKGRKRVWDTDEFNLDAIDRLGGRWRKGKR